MLKRVEGYVSEWNMLKKEDKVIVGVSGGADSVCLLFMLLELQRKIPFEIIAVHVNHGLRGDAADADEKFVQDICKKHSVTCVIYQENIMNIAKERKLSVEEAGRDVRREVFLQTMQQHGGTKIALAHHMNDNVETFFMNAARGTGLKGLGGIKPIAGVYIRPLLCLERREIEEYLGNKGISYRVDDTNYSDEYMRNRVRNQVIPYMEKELNARVVPHLNETMKQLQEIQCYMEEEAEKYFDICVKKEENGYIVLEESFATVPKVFRPMILKKVLVKVGGREKDLGECHIQSLNQLMEKQVGRQVDLPYSMQAHRVYAGILVRKNKEELSGGFEMEIDLGEDGFQEFWWKDKHITCQLLKQIPSESERTEKSNTKWFDYDIIKDKLFVRTRQAGDYITIHPDGRTQKLKSFFVNEKVPQEKREEILLLVEGQHVLWVEGMRTNSIYQVSEHTKCVLEIKINKGESYGRDN